MNQNLEQKNENLEQDSRNLEERLKLTNIEFKNLELAIDRALTDIQSGIINIALSINSIANALLTKNVITQEDIKKETEKINEQIKKDYESQSKDKNKQDINENKVEKQ